MFFIDRGKKLLEGVPSEIVKQYSGLLGEKVYVEFDRSINTEKVRIYLERSGLNVNNLRVYDKTLSFLILDFGKSVIEIMNTLKPLKTKILNIDIKKVNLEEVFNYITLKNEKTIGGY